MRCIPDGHACLRARTAGFPPATQQRDRSGQNREILIAPRRPNAARMNLFPHQRAKIAVNLKPKRDDSQRKPGAVVCRTTIAASGGAVKSMKSFQKNIQRADRGEVGNAAAICH